MHAFPEKTEKFVKFIHRKFKIRQNEFYKEMRPFLYVWKEVKSKEKKYIFQIAIKNETRKKSDSTKFFLGESRERGRKLNVKEM